MKNYTASENYFDQKGHYSFYISLEGFQDKVKVTYDGSWSIMPSIHVIHFAFRSKLVSETGYRSHFTYINALENFNNSPMEYAKALCIALHEEIKKKSSKQEYAEMKYGKQTSLF